MDERPLPPAVAEQIAQQRRDWEENRRFQLRPPLNTDDAWASEVVRVTRTADGAVHYIRGNNMPPQEDEITLLDDAPARAVPRRTIVAVVDPANFPSVNIEPDTIGIEEISMSQAATTTKKVRKKLSIKEVEKPTAILHMGCKVYAIGSMLYTYEHGSMLELANRYSYVDRQSADHVEAVSMMHGTTPVFCTSKAELAKFKALLEKVTITVAAGKTLCFFTGTEYYCKDENVVVLVSDGEIVRYGGRNSDERIMRLNNPIDQKPDQVFAAITSFLARSVKGVSDQLEAEKARLKVITDRRSEDVFLYLSDMTPLPDRQDVHGFAMARLQEAYTTDLSAQRVVQANLEAFKDKIDKAKSQIPNGRKGVPLRNSYLKSPVLTSLLDFFKVIRDGNTMKVIFGFKNDLNVAGISYGRPELTINMACTDGYTRRGGTFILESGGVKVRSADRNAFMHPHIEGTVRWCLGTYIGPVNNAIMGGNIPMAASLLWKYLSTYNPESPLVRIETCRDQMANARPRDLIVRRK